MWSKFGEGELDFRRHRPERGVHRFADGRLDEGEGDIGAHRLDRLFDAVAPDPVVEGDRAAHVAAIVVLARGETQG